MHKMIQRRVKWKKGYGVKYHFIIMKFAGSQHRRCAGTCPAESFPCELRPEDLAREGGEGGLGEGER